VKAQRNDQQGLKVEDGAKVLTDGLHGCQNGCRNSWNHAKINLMFYLWFKYDENEKSVCRFEHVLMAQDQHTLPPDTPLLEFIIKHRRRWIECHKKNLTKNRIHCLVGFFYQNVALGR
jgi:hypothetical protein